MENPELKANNTESLIICHWAFSFIVIVCCKKSKVSAVEFQVVLFLSLIFCKQEEKLLFFGSISG
jgi:hypothetical protein